MTSRIVTALVLVREGDHDDTLVRTLRALGEQERRADRVLVLRWPRATPSVDPADRDRALGDREGIDEVLDVATSTSLSGAVRTALRALPELGLDPDEPEQSWLWFVPADSAPGPRALALELDAAASDELVAVVGAAQRWEREAPSSAEDPVPEPAVRTADDADGLVDVGLTLTHGARIVTGIEVGEIDQGQLDWRADVLAVPLAGMLVREELYRAAGGLDPALTAPWAEIVLCHRVWRRGARVAVVPAAHVLGPSRDPDLIGDPRTHRRGQILTRLAISAWPLVVLHVLLLPLETLARMVGAVVTHRPRGLLDEPIAWAGAMRRAPALLRRTVRAARRARTSRRRLAPLFVSRREAVRRRLEAAWTATFADDERSRRIRRTTWGIAGTTHGMKDADYGRHGTWTLAVALVSIALTALSLRRLIGGGDLVGPALVPLPDDWRTGWQAAWTDWVPTGLGARGAADPLVRLLGHLPLSGAAPTDVILLGAIPLSALAAWWAAGALTRAVGARLVLAVAWALAPALLASLSEGRWPVLVAHVLLPVLALAIGRAVGLPHKVSQASISAAAAGGLVLLVIGAVQPVLVLLVALALALVAIVVPGRRLRLLWVLVPSLALHAPYLPTYLDAPRTLLAMSTQSGVAVARPTATALWGLWPAGAPAWSVAAPWVGADVAALLPVLVLAPVVLGALVAPFLAGAAGTAGRIALVLAGVCLALAVLCAHVAVGVRGDTVLTAPTHLLQSAALLAVLLGAGCTFDALARRDGTMGRTRRVLTTVAAAVVAAATAVTVIGWTLALPGALELTRGQTPQIPAAAADQGRSDARLRTLVLTQDQPDGDGSVVASLVVDGGDSTVQHAAVVAARQAEDSERSSLDADPGSRALLAGTSQLVAGSEDASEALGTLAVGYVVVPGAAADHPELVAALDRSPLLEKVTQNAEGGLWRVIAPRARAAADGGGDDSTLLPSDLILASGHLDPSSTTRTIVLSERREAGWTATVGGHRLERTLVDGWAQGFVVPAGVSGDVVIDRDPWWTPGAQAALAVAVLITLLLAVPWRGRTLRTGTRPRTADATTPESSTADATTSDGSTQDGAAQTAPTPGAATQRAATSPTGPAGGGS